MKFLTFYTETHKQIYEQFFLESFNKFLSKHTLISHEICQLSKTGEYESPGFDNTMLEKIRLIIEHIEVDNSELFVYSDCDVQFFTDFFVDLQDYDILFQDDCTEDNYCAGFFICKQNQQVLNFFHTVESEFIRLKDGNIHDQTIINRLLKDGYDGIKFGKLNKDFWTIGNLTSGYPWSGDDFDLSLNLTVHHANYTVGVTNKILLLNLVKSKMNKKR